ncbi:hypothetical protein H1R20_g12497, partial [Candolleomyces eurysporus]
MGKRNGPTNNAGSRGSKRKRVNLEGKATETLSTVEMLSELPLDIFCEIASWLHPMDLLHLAQTSKLLRRVMLSRTNRVIWTRSMKAFEDLPPCPEDLAEPRYAYLMFSRHCHECLADEPVTTIDRYGETFLRMELRTRLCHQCRTARHKTWKDLPKNVDEALKPLVPHYDDRQRYIGIKCAVLYDVETALALDAQYDQLHSPCDKEAWLQRQTEIHGMAVKHSSACQRFVENELYKEQQCLIRLREKRREQVAEKLKALGWTKELDFLGGIKSLYHPDPLLSVAEELNDQDWNELRPKLVAQLRRARKDVINQENETHIRNRVELWLIPAYNALLASHPPQACLPSLLDVGLIPEFRSALCSTPLDQPMPTELTKAAVERLPSYALEWKSERDQELLGILRQASPYTNQDVSEDALHLVSTIFMCDRCCKVNTYPSVISHSCNFTSNFWVEVRAPGVKRPRVYKDIGSSFSTSSHPVKVQVEDDLARHIGAAVYKANHGSRLWCGFRYIVFDEDRYEHIVNMLGTLQWSRKTLLSEMEERNPYVECLCQCFSRTQAHRSGQQVIMQWKSAVESCRRHRGERSGAQFFAKAEGPN